MTTEPTTVSYVNKDLRGYSFRGQNLSGVDFSNSDIAGCDFSGAILDGANFTGVDAGIDWQNFWCLTIGGLFFTGLLAYLHSPTGIDAVNEDRDRTALYLNWISWLASWLYLDIALIVGLMAIQGKITPDLIFDDLTPPNSVLLCYIGITIFSVLVFYSIIKIAQRFNFFFRTSFRNADLTGAILNPNIMRTSDLTGAIL